MCPQTLDSACFFPSIDADALVRLSLSYSSPSTAEIMVVHRTSSRLSPVGARHIAQDRNVLHRKVHLRCRYQFSFLLPIVQARRSATHFANPISDGFAEGIDLEALDTISSES